MNRIVLLFLLSLGLLLAAAMPLQAQKIIASLDLAKNEPTPLWFEYSRTDGGLVTISYLAKRSSREIGLFKYDDQLKRTWQVKLFEQNGRRTIEHLVVLGPRILIFMAERFPKERNTKISYYEYNIKGELVAENVEFYEAAGRAADKGILSYIPSINYKKLLCFDNLMEKNSPEQAQFFVFDASDEGIVGNRIKFPYPDNLLQLRDVKVGNNGNLMLLARLENESAPKNTDQFTYLVFKFDLESNALEEIELPFDSLFVTDLILKPDRYDDVLVGGFYSKKNGNQIGGILYAYIDMKNLAIIRHSHAELRAEFLAQYLSSRQIEKGRELADFYLDDLVLRSDGGFLLLAEQYYITSTSYRDVYGFWYSNDLFNYEDVAIISVSPEGEIEWAATVDKTQSSDVAAELSYLPLVGTSSLLIFYKTRLKGFGNNVYYQQVDYDGQVGTPRTFFPKFGNRDVFYRQFSEQIGNNEAIFVYYRAKGRIFSLAKVAF